MPVADKSLKRRSPKADIKSLCGHLRNLAYAKGPEAKLPTVRELCATLGTHSRAIDDALQQLEGQKVIYRKQGSGIYVSASIHLKTFLILLDSSLFRQPEGSPFWGLFQGKLAKITEERSLGLNETHNVHIVSTQSGGTNKLSEDTSRWIERGRVDVVIAIGLHDDARLQIEELGIPCVTYAAFGLPQVRIDYDCLIELGVDCLLEQGCQRLGYWEPATPFVPHVPSVKHDPGDADAEYFRAIVERRRAKYYPEFIEYGYSKLAPGEVVLETLQQRGQRVAREVFSVPRESWPDGVLIVDDVMAATALREMRRLGIRPGVDVKVACGANRGSNVLFGCEDEADRIEVDLEELAGRLFQIASLLISGSPVDESLLTVRPHLVVSRITA